MSFKLKNALAHCFSVSVSLYYGISVLQLSETTCQSNNMGGT